MRTEQEISPFNVMQCIAALRIETSTGMKYSRGSVLKYVQETYGVQSKRKAGALAEMEDLYEELTGRRYGSA